MEERVAVKATLGDGRMDRKADSSMSAASPGSGREISIYRLLDTTTILTILWRII